MSSVAASVKNYEPAIRRTVLLAVLYLIAPVQALLPNQDPDIWWHLRVGEWIVANRAVPFEDHFSAYGAGKPWFAYSWLFEVLIYTLHRSFGLSGIVWFTAAMGILITAAVHRLVRLAHWPITAEVALTALAVAAMKPLMSPRPWLFTILFFAIQLVLISRAREEGKARLLWLMPLIFILWANLHVQFIYGLAIMALLLLESVLFAGAGRWNLPSTPSPLRPNLVMAVTALSGFAALISPYHFLIFRPIWEYVVQTGTFQNIQEMHPMFFRSPDNWIVLGLTLAAVFALGWRRRLSPFPMLLLLLGVVLGFRARRDIWLLVVTAVWIVGSHFRYRLPGSPLVFARGQTLAVVVLVALGLFGFGYQRGIREPNLRAVAAQEYPVDAVAYIRSHKLPGPVFNTLDWGGFLIWSLREIPVAIDGRTNLHGEARVAKFVRSWLAYPGWDSDPEFLSAGLIIADHSRPLTWMLQRDPGYKAVYEDGTAVVFVPLESAQIAGGARPGHAPSP
jgi:hypothetical protein